LQLLELSRVGLQRRRRLDGAGNDETGFLVPLQEIAASGITPSERMLASYYGPWQGDVTKAFAEYSY
jgi:glutamate--cysteine ligase